jgi:hypothetical protein
LPIALDLVAPQGTRSAPGVWRLLVAFPEWPKKSFLSQWKALNRTVKDACAALLWHLSQYAPLALVVWSAGKSLQCWFNASCEDELSQRRFMEYAVALGADSALWKKCQLVRLPGGVEECQRYLRAKSWESY